MFIGNTPCEEIEPLLTSLKGIFRKHQLVNAVVCIPIEDGMASMLRSNTSGETQTHEKISPNDMHLEQCEEIVKKMRSNLVCVKDNQVDSGRFVVRNVRTLSYLSSYTHRTLGECLETIDTVRGRLICTIFDYSWRTPIFRMRNLDTLDWVGSRTDFDSCKEYIEEQEL